MLQDLVLFLGLLGFVCSVGMRLSMRRASRGDAVDSVNARAHDTSSPARSARRRQ